VNLLNHLPEPVFVVGMNGSGTTMLLDCLDNHPEIYGFPEETKLLGHLLTVLPKFGDLAIDDNFHALIQTVGRSPAFRHENDFRPPPVPEEWRNMPRNVSVVLDWFFRYFAEKKGKERWCEKTPMNAHHIAALGKVFPKAKFIHIIRDARSCAASCRRRFFTTPQMAALRWKQTLRTARRQGEGVPGRYLEIRYEDLVGEPERWMREICGFLDVPFDVKVLSTSRARTLTASSPETEIAKAEEKWRQELSDTCVARIEKICGALLSECGYRVKLESGDTDPNRLMRKFWYIKDHLRVNFSRLSRLFSNEDDCPFSEKAARLLANTFRDFMHVLRKRY
jgi:hypothetical protein